MAIRIPFIGGQQQPIPAPPGQASPPDGQGYGHTNTAEDPAKVRPQINGPPYGQSGRANFYGLPQWDELNPKLIGPAGLMMLDDMYRQDAHLRRLVLAAWSPIVAGTWTLGPYGGEDASQQDIDIAQAIWWMLNEYMSPSFTEHLMTLGPLLLRMGFTPFEQLWGTCTYKGKTLIAPRKLDVRLPKTIWKWWQDDYGELTHIGQILPNRPDVIIPATELVYYRLGAEGDNWMGTSLLRHAYKHWYLKDKLERIDAIGQERKAVGVPIVYHSPDLPAQTLTAIENALANLHISEVAYLMLPGWKMGQAPQDADPANQFLIDIVQFDSSSGESIQNSIQYHQTAISASFLTDFLELGHHQVGARATAEVQMDPFMTAVNGALLPPVIPPLNRLIDRIRKLNWGSAEGSPRLQVTLHDDASLTEISTYATTLAAQGLLQADPELEDWLRDRAAMPAANADIREAKQAAQKAAMENAAKAAEAGGTVQPDGRAGGQDEPRNPDQPADKPPSPVDAVAAARAKNKQLSRQEAHRIYLDALAAENDWKLAQIDREMEQLQLDSPTSPIAAGLVVHAADTGRVLMVRRQPDRADNSEARGKWEFPGGKLDAGESDYAGGLREWQEETGAALPARAKQLGDFITPDGKYHAHVVRVPRETALKLTPEKKEVSDAAWRNPADLAGDDGVRDKVHAMLPQITRILAGRKQLDQSVQTVCVDFDGVIHPRLPNAAHHVPVGDPLPGAVDGLKKLAEDYHVVICTARQHLDPVRDWLNAHDLGEFAGTVTNVKPPAVAYIDDHAEHFTDWAKVPGQVESEIAAEKRLDAAAPLGGGVASEGGLQMVPDIAGAAKCSCGGRYDESGVCQTCGKKRPGSEDQGANPKKPAAAGKQLDNPPAEPTAKWWERLLSQDRLRDALDGARAHIEAACRAATVDAAQKLAEQARNGADITNAKPTDRLVNALTQHYTDMYHLGRQTVEMELAKQRHALGRQLDDPPTDTETAGGVAAGLQRLRRARQRGEHSAQNIVSRVREVVGRATITGLKEAPAVQTAAEQAALGQLRLEALSNTAAMINDGRYAAAQAASDVMGAYYTSVLDERTCGACEKADNGELLSPDAAVTLGPPNPDCDGADRCRCMLVWVLSNDPAALGAVMG